MTSKQQAALKRIHEAIDGIAVELSQVSGELVANRTMLDSFRTQLVKIAGAIESGKILPKNKRRSSMGRAIVDSWLLAHPLGGKIIVAEQSYLGL